MLIAQHRAWDQVTGSIPLSVFLKLLLRIIWHTSELIIWRTSCESGVKR
jgi:hypothetical protein